MRIDDLGIEMARIATAVPAWHAHLGNDQWLPTCERLKTDGARIIALWGEDRSDRGGGLAVHCALFLEAGVLVLSLPLPGEQSSYPSITHLFPGAARMQRAARDLFGLHAEGADDQRPWLRHAAWPSHVYPLRKSFHQRSLRENQVDDYPFVTVAGEGVHEIPVGPVHAGTIEPGHFRFSIVGERVLRLEQRLGYKHKGIEKRFEQLSVIEGAKLAGRVSGDSTVAYAWAYAMAAESGTGATLPRRALWLRALLLERERIANHLGDLGFLGNDAALAFGLAQFLTLKEDMLRLNLALFGHRYLMDVVVPGGVAHNLDGTGIARLLDEISKLENKVPMLRAIYDEHAGLQDRLMTTGRVAPELAAALGLAGLAGRASGQQYDLRVQSKLAPYDELGVKMVTREDGDVAARVAVRFDEVMESLRLCRLLLQRIPQDDINVALPTTANHTLGLGLVEGWRGEVLIALESGQDQRIRRCHPHDPSWQNWPLLEHAIIGNIVPDFPLINKSFSLSYAGHDL